MFIHALLNMGGLAGSVPGKGVGDLVSNHAPVLSPCETGTHPDRSIRVVPGPELPRREWSSTDSQAILRGERVSVHRVTPSCRPRSLS